MHCDITVNHEHDIEENERPCYNCAQHKPINIEFTYAFQPIVNTLTGTVHSYEALARGPNNESAKWVLDQVTPDTQYRFDQLCRVKAITLAAELGIKCRLNINFLPSAIYRPEDCIKTTLAVAKRVKFPIENIVFEVIESDPFVDHKHLMHIFTVYKQLGFSTAIDDFGAGFSGLNMLADFQPDYIKLDMALVRDIHLDRARQAIIRGVVAIANELSIQVIAEGVETIHEYETLRDTGISLFQGYLFARPTFQGLGNIVIP